MQCKCGAAMVDRKVDKKKILAITFQECLGDRCKRVTNIKYHNGYTQVDFRE